MQGKTPGAGWNKFKIVNRNEVEYQPGHPNYRKGSVTRTGGPDFAVQAARARKARIAQAGMKPASGRPKLPGGPDRPPVARPPRPPRPPRKRPPMPPGVFDSQ